MEKIIKPSEYAKEMGISRQAVYAKIKRGILKSKEVDGKLYIVVEDNIKRSTAKKATTKKQIYTTQSRVDNVSPNSYEELLKAKDETISVLKSTISDLKESNKEISTTLRSEIDLLKEAFYEMRILYTNQLEHHSSKVDAIEIEQHLEEDIPTEEIMHKWISVKKFCKYYNLKDKKIEKYNKIFKKLYKNNDSRIIKSNDKYKIDILQDFSDILA